MQRLRFLILVLGVVSFTSQAHMATAATEGVEALVNADFTFTFGKEGPKGGDFKALGTSDAVLNTHLNRARCLCDEKLQINVALSADGLAKLGTETVVGKLVFGAKCNDTGVNCASVGNEFTFTRTAGTLQAQAGAADLFKAVAADDATACSGVEGNFTFWLLLTKDGVRATALPSKSLYLDSTPPEQPVIQEILPSDGAAVVKWKSATAGSVSGYQILCSPNTVEPSSPAFTYCPSPLGQPEYVNMKFCSGKISSGSSEHRVRDLQNASEYVLSLVSIDNSGNVSPFSGDMKVTPAPSLSFHDIYEDAGGEAEGGCQVGGRGGARQGLALLFGVMTLAGMLRVVKRYKAKAAAVFIALASLPVEPEAHADTLGIIEPGPRHEIDKLARSERGFNLNLGVGFYRPDVDSEFGGDGPFARAFGNDERALWQMRLERLLWQKVGTLSLGLGAGYYRAKGTAFLLDGRPSEDETFLQVVPVTLDLGYQYDMWVRRGWGLMPFARAGLDRAFWFMSDQDSVDASGGTNGWHAALGLAFALDALDPESAQQLDSETGVNHTLIYAEYLMQDLSGLGSSKRLQLSDSMLSIGISLQM